VIPPASTEHVALTTTEPLAGAVVHEDAIAAGMWVRRSASGVPGLGCRAGIALDDPEAEASGDVSPEAAEDAGWLLVAPLGAVPDGRFEAPIVGIGDAPCLARLSATRRRTTRLPITTTAALTTPDRGDRFGGAVGRGSSSGGVAGGGDAGAAGRGAPRGFCGSNDTSPIVPADGISVAGS
jgi:hypothetical protein